MPRSAGLRDDDMLGRLAEIETRLDALEGGHDAPTGRTTDAMRVPERDERRDDEARNRQVHVLEGDREQNPMPSSPEAEGTPADAMAGAAQVDNVRTIEADVRGRAEHRAAREQDAPKDKPSDDKKDKPKG